MTYTNFPVYIGDGNKKFSSNFGYVNDRMIYANSANVNYQTKFKADRKITENVNDGSAFVYDGDLTCSVDFSFYFYPYLSRVWNSTIGDYVTGVSNVYSFLMDNGDYGDDGLLLGNATGRNYFPIKIGDNIYNKCFLDSYSIQVDAFQPVLCSAKFMCYEPLEQGSTEEDSSIAFDKYNDLMSGQKVVSASDCELSGLYGDVVSADVVPRVTYTRNYRRTPVYGMTDIKPVDYLMDAVECQMDIESTGLSNFFNYSGSALNGDMGLRILNSDGERILPEYNGGFDFVVGSGARVNQQNYGVQGGDTIKTRVTINESII